MEALKSIDRDLIQLLGQRIAVLASTHRSDLTEESDVTQLLAELNVPTFVWQNLVTSCAAAATTAAMPPRVKPRRVTVIGGMGQMGRFFTQQLLTAGHSVKILGRDWQDADKLLQHAELVLVCVPIQQTLTVIQAAAPHLSPSTTIADIASIKTPVVQAILDCHPGPVLSLHPMFGAGVQSFLSQNVVVCPGRQPEAFQWFLDLIDRRGGNLIVCSPEEHDRMMVFIQTIRHFCTFGLGVFLVEAGIDPDRTLAFSSSPFRLQLNLISRLFAQDFSLCLEMMASLEERRQAISALAATYNRLAQLLTQEDYATLKQAFESTRSVFQDAMPCAPKESNHVIESLSVLLAADKTKLQRSPKDLDLAPERVAVPH